MLWNRAIASVKRQTFTDWELIVVSDGPDLEFRQMPISIEEPISRWELPEHMGDWGATARRRGAAIAQGDIVAYLDDDNAWRPNHLMELVDAFKRHPAASFAYTQMRIMSTGQVIGTDPPQVGGIDSSVIAHVRGVLEIYGNWPDYVSYVQDWETVERWMKNGARWVHIPMVTVDYYTDARRQ